MFKVSVRYEKMDEPGVVKLIGYTEELPEKGKTFAIQVFRDFAKVIVDFGRVYNIESFGDLFLTQTEWTVLEVKILGSGEPPKENLLPLRRKSGNFNVKNILTEIEKLNNLARKEPVRKASLRLIKTEEILC